MKNLINLKLTLCTLLLMLLTTCNDDDPMQYQLTTEVTPAEKGTLSPAPGLYNEGTEIELKATPIEEYIFKNWTGDASGNDNPLQIIMLGIIKVWKFSVEIRPIKIVRIICNAKVREQFIKRFCIF